MRIGEASNPGPPSNVRRVSGASQLSGASTFPAASREVRAVLRGVPGSDPTVVGVRSGRRFAPLSEPSGVEREGRRGERRRLLVLIFPQEIPESDHEWDSDTHSIGGASGVEGVDVVEATARGGPPSFWKGDCGLLKGRLRVLDAVNLSELFESRPRLTRSVPHILRGVFRSALRVAFQEILAGEEANSEAKDIQKFEVALGVSKNAAPLATSRRHSSSQEVGGQAQSSSKKVVGSLFRVKVQLRASF